jgi:hypothetical protein
MGAYQVLCVVRSQRHYACTSAFFSLLFGLSSMEQVSEFLSSRLLGLGAYATCAGCLISASTCFSSFLSLTYVFCPTSWVIQPLVFAIGFWRVQHACVIRSQWHSMLLFLIVIIAVWLVSDEWLYKRPCFDRLLSLGARAIRYYRLSDLKSVLTEASH